MTLCSFLIASCPTLWSFRRFRQGNYIRRFSVTELNSGKLKRSPLFFMLLWHKEMFHCSIDFIFSLFRTSLCFTVLPCKWRNGWLLSNNRVSVTFSVEFALKKLFMKVEKRYVILDDLSDLFWLRDFDRSVRYEIRYFSTVSPPKCKAKVSNSVIRMPRIWRQFHPVLAYLSLFTLLKALLIFSVCSLWFPLYI